MTSRTGGPPAAPSPCPRLHDCAAYVLGALDEADRLAHEAHLPTCAECSAAVADFAGLPALMRASDGLTGAEPAAADAPPDLPLPDTLLPRLLHAVAAEERRARRRRVGLGLVAAAAAAVLGGASIAVVDANLRDGSDATASAAPSGSDSPADSAGPSGEAPERITLATEPGAPIEAFVMLQAKGWGTAFETHCTYTGSGGSGYPPSGDYELVAVDADGQEHTVSTWAAGGGATVHVVPASSYLDVDDISSLRLTTVDGTLIASATL